MSPDNQRLYVVGNHQLFIVIDIASRSRIATVAHNQGGALGIAASPDGSRVYVMATGSHPRRGAGHRAVRRHRRRADGRVVCPERFAVPVAEWPSRLRAAAGHARSQRDSDRARTPPRVVILDTATGAVMTTAAGNVPWHVGISPDGATIYVTSYRLGGSMHRLNPSTHASMGRTTVSRGFTTAFLSDSTRAYVAATRTSTR